MAEEMKKDDAPCCGGTQSMMFFWAIGGLALGLIIGYLVFPGMAPTASTGTDACGNSTAGTAAFALDQAKVSQIGGFLANYYYVSMGEETTATFSRYVDKGPYVELYYTVAGQEMPIMVSKDYRYFYAGAYDLQTTIAQMDAARQEASQAAQAEAAGVPKSANPQVLMFVMSYCPGGNQAENGLAPVIELLGEKASFEPVYIIYPRGRECAENNGVQYCSLHGNAELWQDVREKIIFGMYGEKKWAEYVSRANAECSLSNIDTCWATVAEEVGVNTSAVLAEFEASKFDILASEMAKTNEYRVSGSPTIMINGYTYNGARTPEAYKSKLCEAFTNAPEECGQELSTVGAAAAGSC